MVMVEIEANRYRTIAKLYKQEMIKQNYIKKIESNVNHNISLEDLDTYLILNQ